MSSPPTMGTGASSCSVATLMPHAYPNPDGCGDASELRRFPHVRRVKPSDVSLERDQPGYCGDLSSTDLPEPDACHLFLSPGKVWSCRKPPRPGTRFRRLGPGWEAVSARRPLQLRDRFRPGGRSCLAA